MIGALLSLFAGGCMVGPNYKTPSAAVADNWIDYQRPATQPSDQHDDLAQWWQVFDDPVLNSLVSDAYKQNLSLRVAGERIAESRSVRAIAIGNLFPQSQTMSGSYSAVKASDRAANAGNEQWFRNTEIGFNLNWELDFWGRFRRSIEAADASLDASIANYDDVLVVLLSDVAANYIQYRTFQERLALARDNVRIQEDAYQLASDNFRLGRATERDPQQSKQVLEQTRASVPQFEAGMRRSSNALCVLLGIPPQELSQRLGDTGMIPVGKPNWSVGVPAELLRRRPDVRRAERQAAAQSAAIGIATADLYPSFSLSGSIGVQSEDCSDLFKTPGSLTGFVGPAFNWNILNYGRLRGAVQVQEARFRQLALFYEDTVLRANREAEDAMITYVKAQERMKYLTDSVVAARRTVEITHDQYRQGAIDFTPVFIFEAALTSQQDDLAQAQADIALSLVDLYRSLGGGWEADPEGGTYEAPAVPAPTTQRSATSRPSILGATTRPMK